MLGLELVVRIRVRVRILLLLNVRRWQHKTNELQKYPGNVGHAAI